MFTICSDFRPDYRKVVLISFAYCGYLSSFLTFPLLFLLVSAKTDLLNLMAYFQGLGTLCVNDFSKRSGWTEKPTDHRTDGPTDGQILTHLKIRQGETVRPLFVDTFFRGLRRMLWLTGCIWNNLQISPTACKICNF